MLLQVMDNLCEIRGPWKNRHIVVIPNNWEKVKREGEEQTQQDTRNNNSYSADY